MQDPEHLRLMVDAAPIAIIVADCDGRITLANAQGARIFGYAGDELLGRPIESLVPDRFRGTHTGLRSEYLQAMEDRLMGTGPDIYGLRKDGTEVALEIGLHPITTPQGNFTLAAIVDITERKRAEEVRLQHDRDLDASQLKSQFVATMSHELRTPLNAIVGTAELLGTTALDARQRAYARTIDASAEALLAVISSILDFSKIEAGKIELETRDFELETLVAAAAGVLAQEVRHRGLTLHTFVDPLIPSVLRGDVGRLRQILLNLVGNAVKFTATGYVVVRARPIETSSQHVTVEFEVRDTGAGISADVIPQLFNPFVQGAASSPHVGTGLGLSISKRLAELMHGEIGVSSELGVGSVFWFTARFARSNVTRTTRHIAGARVLLVSQDDVFNEIVAHYADAWDLPNQSLKGPVEAIAALESAGADAGETLIVIADADTVDATLIRNAMDRFTGPAQVRMVRVGRDERLTKPLSPSQLFDRIAEALSGDRDAPVGAWDGVNRRSA